MSPGPDNAPGGQKAPDAFRTISEVAEELGLPQHVLRFWETRFNQIKPLKRGGGRRYYRPDDVDLLRAIRHLLYDEGYTIRGVQRLLKEQGQRGVIALWRGEAAGEPPAVHDVPEPEREDEGAADLVPEDLAPEDPDEEDAEEPAAEEIAAEPAPPVQPARPAAPVLRPAPPVSYAPPPRQLIAEPAPPPPAAVAPPVHVTPPRVDPVLPRAPQAPASLPPLARAPDPREATSPGPVTIGPAPSVRMAPAGLTSEDARRLNAALHELEACKQLLEDAARR